jgi:hypothetical protein
MSGEAGTNEIRDAINADNDESGQDAMSEGGHKVRNPEQSPDGELAKEHQQGPEVDHGQGRHVGFVTVRGPRARFMRYL